MLPSVNAPKLAVVWVSACPLLAVVSGAGAATSVVIGKLASKCFTAAKPAAYSLAVWAWHSAILGPHHAGMHSSLSPAFAPRLPHRDRDIGSSASNRNLGADFNHPSGRNLEIIGGVVGRAAERDEQMLLPFRQSRMRRRLQRAPGHEKRRRHDVELPAEFA